MIYLVSRHAGVVTWCRQQGLDVDTIIPHLEPTIIMPGDMVIGTLPIQLAAQVHAHGARYLHLSVPTPQQWRGHELSAEQLAFLGTSLQEFHIEAL